MYHGLYIPLIFYSTGFYDLFSFTRWQITSTEKLNARAKATDSQMSREPMATMVITRQNKLVIAVSAFFSEKYFLKKGRQGESSFFIIVS